MFVKRLNFASACCVVTILGLVAVLRHITSLVILFIYYMWILSCHLSSFEHLTKLKRVDIISHIKQPCLTDIHSREIYFTVLFSLTSFKVSKLRLNMCMWQEFIVKDHEKGYKAQCCYNATNLWCLCLHIFCNLYLGNDKLVIWLPMWSKTGRKNHPTTGLLVNCSQLISTKGFVFGFVY